MLLLLKIIVVINYIFEMNIKNINYYNDIINNNYNFKIMTNNYNFKIMTNNYNIEFSKAVAYYS